MNFHVGWLARNCLYGCMRKGQLRPTSLYHTILGMKISSITIVLQDELKSICACLRVDFLMIERRLAVGSI